MKDFEERHGVRIFQAWGMTETSPVATYSRPDESGEHDDAYWDERAKQGRPLPWVELRLSTTTARGALGRRVHGRDRGARAVGRGALLNDDSGR